MTGKRLRRSRQRTRIIELLRQSDQHPTAGWIYDHLKQEFPNLSLGTVYRNLGLLVDQGTVRRIDSGSTFDRFEIDRGDHLHFVCDRCGRIIDVEMPEIAAFEQAIRRRTGNEITGHRIELFGICEMCRSGD